MVGFVNTQTINHGRYFPISSSTLPTASATQPGQRGAWQVRHGRRFRRRWHFFAIIVGPVAVEMMRTKQGGRSRTCHLPMQSAVPRQAVGRGGERAISTLMVTTVGTLPQGYVRNVPLPRIPLRQSTSSNQMHMIPDYYEVPHGVPPYNTSRSIVENAAYAFSPAWHAIAIYT